MYVKEPPNTHQPSLARVNCHQFHERRRRHQFYKEILLPSCRTSTPILDAIGRWTPGDGKKIVGFKFKQNLGKAVLIGICSAGVQGRKNHSSGWCQFIRSARVLNGEVMLWGPAAKGLMGEVYLYMDDKRPMSQTYKLEQGVAADVQKTLVVACIPKGAPFFEVMAVGILKWSADGSGYGASTKFRM
jgi:hypothetical protein